jgi:hypothetical protein
MRVAALAGQPHVLGGTCCKQGVRCGRCLAARTERQSGLAKTARPTYSYRMSGWSTPRGPFKPGPWVYLSDDLKRMYLSHFARFGDWSDTVKQCHEIPPDVQAAATELRRKFLALAPQIRDAWAGDFPAPAPKITRKAQ